MTMVRIAFSASWVNTRLQLDMATELQIQHSLYVKGMKLDTSAFNYKLIDLTVV